MKANIGQITGNHCFRLEQPGQVRLINTDKGNEQEKPKTDKEEEENDYFPIAYIFSSEQVNKAKPQKAK